MRNKTTRILITVIALMFSTLSFASPAVADLKWMNATLKNVDNLTKSEMNSAFATISTDYIYEPVEKCATDGSASSADAERTVEWYRNFLQVKLECKIKFFKQEQAFLKTADANARKEIARIFSPKTNELTPEAAKEAVLLAMKTIPRSKVHNVMQLVLMRVRDMLESEVSAATAWDFGRNKSITGVNNTLFDSTDPVVNPMFVYRAAKKTILLSDEVWEQDKGSVSL